jgi:hypothetical protein
MLAGNEVVQKELKLSDRQKELVKKVSDEQNQKRREVFQQLRQQTDMAKAQIAQQAEAQALAPQQIDPSVDARGSGAGSPLAGALNTRGYQPQIYAGQPLVDPALQQQAALAQGQQAINNVQAQGWEMMRQAMQELQQAAEHEVARALDKNQFKRLKEIQLQVEGASAVLRDDVAEKLEIREDQHAEIQGILNETNAARRQIMAKNFQFMRSLMPNQPGGGIPPGPGGQADATGGRRGQGTGAATQGGPGGQGAPGGRGGRGGPGGQNRPRFDPEAMRKMMEQPEVKAKMEETRKEQGQLREREYAMVYKAMDRRQVSTFKKMLGKPFDVESLMGAFFRGGPGRGNGRGPGASANQSKDAGKSDTAKTEPSAKPDTKSSTTSKPATTPRRQSLRERRGLGQQSAPADSPN